MSDFVTEARGLAIAYHEGQLYGSQSYYEGHILPVVLQAEIIALGCGLSSTEVDVVRAIAYTHDLLEDSSCALEEIRGIYRVPDAVPNSVEALTNPEGMPYSHYLMRVINHTVYTVIVKIADSMVNLRASLATGRRDGILKYANNINFLSAALSRAIEKRQSR